MKFSLVSFLLALLALLAGCGGLFGSGSDDDPVPPEPTRSISITPSSTTLETGETVAFSATVTGVSDTEVTWSVVQGSGGTIDSNGNYTAPSSAGTFIVRATSVADATLDATATVTVNEPAPGPTDPITVRISPISTIIQSGSQQQFVATVENATDSNVTWEIVETGDVGTINSSGLYTAPATEGQFTIRATSVEDPTKFGTGRVEVVDADEVSVSIQPLSAAVIAGETRQFTVNVEGASDPSVTWRVIEPNGGTITSNGLYTAPIANGTFTVEARSKEDTTKAATASVDVTLDLSVVIDPPSTTVQVGNQFQFSATVIGIGNNDVTWSVEESNGGTINASGLYTAPSNPGNFTIRATSVSDPNASDTAEVSVFEPTLTPSIAFQSRRDGNWEIYIMDQNGQNQDRVTNNAANDQHPSISPDGLKIAFTSDRGGSQDIYVMNVDGSNVTRLTNTVTNAYGPKWNPDGSKIVYTQNDGTDDEVFVMNSDGTGQTQLTNSPFRSAFPVWSPDGDKIAYITNELGAYFGYLMNTNGSGQSRLTAVTISDTDGPMAYHPNGDLVIYLGDLLGWPNVGSVTEDGSTEITISAINGDKIGLDYMGNGTQILFGHRQVGDPVDQYDIYRIEDDGTGLTRLTTASGEDTHPDYGLAAR